MSETKQNVKMVPLRSEICSEDTWDLTPLFVDVTAWETVFDEWEKKISEYAQFRQTLGGGAENFLKCLEFHFRMQRVAERLGTYAFLRTAEDGTSSEAQHIYGKFIAAASRCAQESSYIMPEILALPESTLNSYLEDAKLALYHLWLSRLIEEKTHTLSEKEERLLAMQTEMSQVASNSFEKLTDSDMRFGEISDHEGSRIELSQASFSALLHGPNREVRKQAFTQFYEVFGAHRHTLAAMYAGSVHKDVYYARARNFNTAREAVLFSERIPVEVYDNLIVTVREFLPVLHRYYAARQKMMKLTDLHMYDTYVPIIPDVKVHYPWDTAVEMVLEAVKPLGTEYTTALKEGLTTQRWCDRYENRGKQSGAFSCGSYDGLPYILMNYKESVLDHVFTLAHEAGHSMHSYLSTKNQPYLYHDYELFVAEVASTFNEQLLHHYMMKETKDELTRLNLVCRLLDELRGTIFRQTMFAEFELQTHTAAENGMPLTVDFFMETYHKLLCDYFGPDFSLDECLDLECFRIPHFYRAFYVYKYATGISAAMALSKRVLHGGKSELEDYLKFLSGGSSQTPLELMKTAGVDMSTPVPIQQAMTIFEENVKILEEASRS
ncbi:MAG: oligoendopeptidase F [Planctomycetia bacterium]|nr:oligoendopeptidase F [Planctomycetia bacterium]